MIYHIFHFNSLVLNYVHKNFFKVFGEPINPNAKKVEFDQRHKDVAAAFQKVLEDRVLQLCKILKKKTGAKHLVFAGGVALNSVVNGRNYTRFRI